MTIRGKKFTKSVITEPTPSAATEEGEIRNDSADNKQKVYTEGAEREIVTADQTQTLSNKTIDSANNTVTVDADTAAVSNIEVDNLKAGVLETDLNNAVDDTNLPSAQAVKTYVAQEVATKDEASEISYDNVASGLTATNVQAAVDEVEARLDTAEADVDTAQATADNHIADATDAHAASAITNTPSGNLAATDVQGALDELQSDVDTRALDADLTSHLNDAVDAHDATAVSYDNTTSGLAATEVQAAIDEVEGRLDTAEADITAADSALSDHLNDTTDAHDASAISNTASGNLTSTDVQSSLEELQTDIDTRALDSDLTSHTSATSGVHGVTGDVVGTTDAQTLTDKTLDGASIEAPTRLDVKQDTFSNLQTYATTATNGQIVFATDTKQMFQVVDAGLTAIGGEGGGGTSFTQEQTAHGFALLDAIYHNGTDWQKAQANDAATLATHIVSEVADADNFTAQNFGRFEATAHGKTVGEFYFLSESVAGGSDVTEGSVYSAPLYYVEDANTIHALVYRPSLRPQNTQFREDVDVLENILAFDTTSAGFSTETTINGETFRLTHDASVTRFAEVDLTVTPKFRDKILELPVDLKSTATSGNFKVIITDLTNSKTLADEVLQPQLGSETVKRVVSFSTKPVDGDLAIQTIRVRFEALAESGAVSDFDDVLVQLKKTQSLEVIAIEQEENVFSAVINADASIKTQSYPFLSSVTSLGPGVYRCNFKSGFFSEVPSVQATPNFTGASDVSFSSDTTLTYVDVVTRNTSAVNSNNSFSITVTRQGSDYRNLERRIEREVSTFKEVLVEEADSFIDVGGSGNGLSGAQTLTFSSINKTLGSDISYNSSTGQFTVQSAGIYHATVSDECAAADAELSVRVNGQNKTLQTIHNVLRRHSTSWSGYLEKGDYISFFSSNTRGSGGVRVATVAKQGSLKKASVAPDSKITIPTSEVIVRGVTGLGSGSESRVVQYNELSKIVGDGLTVDNSNGTKIIVNKDGLLNLRADAGLNTTGSLFLTVNNPDRTVNNPTGDFIKAFASNATGLALELSVNLKVAAGDVIHVISNNGVSSNTISSISAVHQEQNISVAVSNVTPQFEDADSMVRVTGSFGYGSIATKIRRFSSVVDNIGSDITYTDSATDGASFTVNTSGIYHISYSDEAGAVISDYLGISKNSSLLNTDIFSIPSTERLAIGSVGNEDGEYRDTVSWSGYLQKGDVIRPHGTGTLASSPNTLLAQFTIARQGKPSIAEVDVTPFVNLDQYRTKYHSVRAEGNGGESITAGTTNIPFNLVKDTSGAWNGSQYTVQESNSILTITGIVRFTTAAARIVEMYKNGTVYKNIEATNPPASEHALTYISSIGEFSKGDVLSFRTEQNGGTLLNDPETHYLNIVEEYEEQGRSKFHSIAQTENEFSARIANNGTASIVSESESFIDSVVRESQGVVRVNFISGFFTEVPSVQATVSADAALAFGGTRSAEWGELDTTGVRIYTKFSDASNNSFFDYDFHLEVSRQGADRKDLQNAIVQLSDMPRVNRTLTQSLTHSSNTDTLLDGTAELRYNPANISVNGDSILEVVDNAGSSRTEFTAKRKCRVNISASTALSVAGNRTDIYLNGAGIAYGTNNYSGGTVSEVSASLVLQPGDFISVNVTAAVQASNVSTFVITAEAQELERISNVEADGEYYLVPWSTANFWDTTSAPERNWDFSLLTPQAGSPSFSSSNLLEIDEATDPATTRIVAKKKIELDLTAFGVPTNTGAAAVYIRNSSNQVISASQDANVYFQNVTANIILEKGDYVYIEIPSGMSNRSGGIVLKAKPSLSSVVVGLNPLKFQTKILSSSVGNGLDASDLTFNNLVIGKTYRLSGNLRLVAITGFNTNVNINNGASPVATCQAEQVASGFGMNYVFIATDSSVTFTVSAGSSGSLFGNGTKTGSYATLEELPEAIETTDFS